MTEVLITKDRYLVGVSSIDKQGSGIVVDPAGELGLLRMNEENLRRRVLCSGYPDVDGAMQWCTAKAELLQLEGRPTDVKAVLNMGTKAMMVGFGPRAIVEGLVGVLSEIEQYRQNRQVSKLPDRSYTGCF